MKKRLRALVVALCTLALAVTPMFAAWGDTSSGEMKASDQTYAGGVPTSHIQSFKLDGLYSYESLGTDDGKNTLTLSTSALQNIVKNKLLPQWSPIAASVFRDQAGQLVDLYGYEDNNEMMSQTGFDAYFNRFKSSKDYSGETWSIYNLKNTLAQTWASHAGDPGWDQLTVSGVKQVNSLKEARTMVGQALYDCENHKGLRADEFLGVDEGNGAKRLGTLDEEEATTGFANLVTSVNCKGSSAEFDYVAFGIVFYDFEAVPVAADGLAYVSQGFKTEENQKGNNESVISNGQQQEIAHSAKLGDSVTETTSTTISALASAEVNEKIGANMSWSETETSEETNFWGDDDGIGASTSGSSETTTMGLDWGAAWGMAAAAGAEKGHSKSEEISKAVETTVLLPAHTAASVSHTTTTTTYSQTYQQPVILNYKVAIYAVSGDFSSAGDGGINGPSYDKQSLVIKFDTKEEDPIPSYGCVATDDLYSRVVTNKRVANYDVAGGRTYETHCDKSAWSKSENIDWDSVMSIASSYYGMNVIEGVAKKNYFYETPGKLNVDQDKTSSKVGPIYPLYGLSYVETPKTEYVLYTGNVLDRNALTVTGYNQYKVPFYGFDPTWGEWNRCDKDGTIINGGLLLDDDPAYITDQGTLAPKSGTEGGTIYLKWFIEKEDAKPMTGESPNGQNLAASNIASPVVTVNVVNSRLDNPSITAEGSYTGYKGAEINLNNVMTYLVKDDLDRIIETQVRWISQEPTSYGIDVDESTGNVKFTKAGTYHVRPYIINNSNKTVVPRNSDGSFKWLTVTVTDHDLTHCNATVPTCTTDGLKEHYKCKECDKYYSDAEGKNEISKNDLIIPAIGHSWGDWTTTRELTGSTPGEERRVCSNDASHVETRNLYSVKFNMNGHGQEIPAQTVRTGASAKVPQEPTAAGYTFDGWFTDSACGTPYDFSAIVESNLTLYAKWSVTTHTVAAMAVSYDVDEKLGVKDESRVKLTDHGSISIDNGAGVQTATVTYGGVNYTCSYKTVPYGTPVTLQVSPRDNYGLQNLEAIPVSSDEVAGQSFMPTKTGDNAYTLTVTDADIAVVASFSQVTVTFDGNKPANANVTNVPTAQKIASGSRPTQPDNPTIEGLSGAHYEFDGWCTDKECTKPYKFDSAITESTTLYAKWIQTSEARFTVTYKLYDAADSTTALYKYSYQVTDGALAYDPTDDLYEAAGKDILAGYELYSANGSCWFTDEGLTSAFNFTTPIKANTTLHARVDPRKFTVKFYDGKLYKGQIENVTYNTPIGDLPDVVSETSSDGLTLSGWTTKDGVPWITRTAENTWVSTNPVTSDLDLYASWTIQRCTVHFNENAPAGSDVTTLAVDQTVDYLSCASEPSAPTWVGHTFGGWFTDAACETAYNFNTAVTSDLTLYAKWTINEYTVTFDANGHGEKEPSGEAGDLGRKAPAAQPVEHGKKATRPDPVAGTLSEEGYTFGGWFTSSDNGATLSETAYDFDTPVTSDLTLYAKWTGDPFNVTVSVKENGTVVENSNAVKAYLGDGNTAITTAPCGSTVTLKLTPKANYGLETIGVKDASDNDIALKKVDSSTYTFTMPASNVTASAEFLQVTVTFMGNAPTGTVQNVPAEQKIAYGTVPAEPTPEPTLEGYDFAGWCTDSACTTFYLLTPITKDTPLYAKWVEKNKGQTVSYTLYDIEGSNPESYGVSALVKNGDTAPDLTDYVNGLLTDYPQYYTGYELYTDASGHAWFTDENYTTPYNFASRVNEDIDLYAKIVPMTYTVRYFSAPPNAEGSKLLTTAFITHGTPIGNSAPKPTMDGRVLSSWKNAEGNTHWDLTAPVTGNLDLYADWENNKYTVTFEANGHGTAPDALPNVVHGNTVNQPKDPEETGYTFHNWCTDPECTKVYDFRTAVTSDLRLYANWTETECNVAFNTNGAGLGPAAQTVVYGGKATEPAAPTLKGKFFGGWFTSDNNGTLSPTAYDFENTPVTSDLTLYAQWTDSHDVTFNANGHGTAPAVQTVEDGKPATDPGALTATGYTFGGWFTDAACKTAYKFDTPVKSDLTLYAKWTAEKRTVTFNANGHGTAPAVQTVDYGSKAQKPTDPTADGYTFGGWFTDAACKTAFDFNAPVTANLTLYAKWTAEKRTVTFDANGHGTAPAVQTVDYGSKAQKPADPTVEGYTFGGWFTDAACKTAYDFNAPVTANLTLYAKWTAEKKEEPEPEPDHRTKTAPATWDRLWGQTALDTMAFIVDEGGFASGGTVVLATFDGYWDALTAAGIAGKLNAPVLMTPAGELSAQTRTALKSLKPSRIVVCGGTAAIPDDIANAAAAVSDAELVRCWGDFAVNTAEDIADKAQALSGEQWADTAFLCTNDGYWDALAAAPISYAKNMPIFLVNGHDTVESSTFDAMRSVGVKNVCLVGGEAAISPAAEQAVRDAGFNVTSRLGGTTAIETSEAVASYGLSLGMTADYMGVATINGYWDALAGAPLCGKRNSVLVLVAGSDSHSISGFIKDHDLSIVSAYVFGGKNAIDEATYDAIMAATATVPGGDLSAQGGDLVAASAAGL